MTAGLVDDLLMTCSKSYEFKKSNKLDWLAGLSLAQLSPSLFRICPDITCNFFQRKYCKSAELLISVCHPVNLSGNFKQSILSQNITLHLTLEHHIQLHITLSYVRVHTFYNSNLKSYTFTSHHSTFQPFTFHTRICHTVYCHFFHYPIS